MDPATLRVKNFAANDQFPYKSLLAWEYGAGDYHADLHRAMHINGCDDLRREKSGSGRKAS